MSQLNFYINALRMKVDSKSNDVVWVSTSRSLSREIGRCVMCCLVVKKRFSNWWFFKGGRGEDSTEAGS